MPSTDRRIRVWWLLTSSLLLVATSRPALTQQSAAPTPAEIDRQVEVLLAHLNGRWRWQGEEFRDRSFSPKSEGLG
jgi:hypothetical protein